jgi:hypothetical protein
MPRPWFPAPARGIFRVGLAIGLFAVSWLAFAPLDGPALPVSDKTSHVLAFAVLAWLAHGAFPGRNRAQARWGLLLGYGLFIEAVQSQLPYRDASWLDFAADALGVLAYVIAAGALERAGLAVTPSRSA